MKYAKKSSFPKHHFSVPYHFWKCFHLILLFKIAKPIFLKILNHFNEFVVTYVTIFGSINWKFTISNIFDWPLWGQNTLLMVYYGLNEKYHTISVYLGHIYKYIIFVFFLGLILVFGYFNCGFLHVNIEICQNSTFSKHPCSIPKHF